MSCLRQENIAAANALPNTCFSGQGQSTVFAGSGCGIVSTDSSGFYLSRAPALTRPLLLAPDLFHVVNVAADATAVYWTDATGAIGRLPLP
jgi:hypothetical protein